MTIFFKVNEKHVDMKNDIMEIMKACFRLSQPIKTLSGGWRMKMGLARAILQAGKKDRNWQTAMQFFVDGKQGKKQIDILCIGSCFQFLICS